MIREEKLMKEVKWLEKEVEGMTHPTRSAFLKSIGEFKKRLEADNEECEIPEWLTIHRGTIEA